MKRWQNYAVLLIACVALQACADQTDGDGDTTGGLAISKISPAKGMAGVVVTVEGEKFVQGMHVCFDKACGAATVIADKKATIPAPAGTGTVDVCVKVGDESSCLSKAFTYTGAISGTCTVDGVKCSEDKMSLVTCKDKVETTTPCPNGCENNACKPESPLPPGGSTLPSVTGLSPVSGKANTEITVTGNNLETTSRVCFGLTCVDPKSKDKTSVKAVAPNGTGIVTVSLKVGERTVNAGNFTYVVDTQDDNVVDWCQFMYAETSVETNKPIQAYAQVYKQGVTGTGGTHNGLEGEFGFISNDSADVSDVTRYRWVKAVRNGNFAGDAANNNDEFMLDGLMLGTGSYRVAYRFSLNKGNFLYCDETGSQDGFDVSKLPVVNVHEKIVEPEKTVAWCQIISPVSLASTAGEDSEHVYAQAFVKDCTGIQKDCPELKAQIGYINAANVDVTDLNAAVTWSDAAINPNFNGQSAPDNDEFMAKLKTDKAGEYKVIYRVSVDNGKTWTYCDAQYNQKFNLAEGLTWHVEAPEGPTPSKVDWCKIQYPATIQATVGDKAVEVYGRVHVPDCTGTEKGDVACEGLQGRVKVASGSGEPTYIDAVFNAPARGNQSLGSNDEFIAKLAIPESAGDYKYVYQFKGRDDADWVNCDTAGVNDKNEPAFDENKAGKLTVENPPVPEVDWCRIVNSPAASAIGINEDSAPIFAQAYVAGCTHYQNHCNGLKAEIGYKKDGGEFKWSEAGHNAEFHPTGNAQNNEEFMAKLNIPEVGKYDVFYRMTRDDGKTWKYCGVEGVADVEKDPGYVLDVIDNTATDPGKTVGWCQLKTGNARIKSGTRKDGQEIEGEVYVEGCTSEQGQCSGLLGYVGIGTAEQPVEDYIFVPAQFVSKNNNNEVFKVKLDGRLVAADEQLIADGDYKTLYAFSVNNGETMTFCDTDGVGGAENLPFETAKLGSLKVEPRYAISSDLQCGFTEAPQNAVAGASAVNYVFGELYWKGKTEQGKGSPIPQVKAMDMYYIEQSKAKSTPIETNPGEWTSMSAVLSGNNGNNQRYVAYATFQDPGKYAYVFALDLVYDVDDIAEIPQRIYCYAGWRNEMGNYGEINVTEAQ